MRKPGAPPCSYLEHVSEEAQDYRKMREKRAIEQAEMAALHKRFAARIREKIDSLPIPPKLQDFIAYYRSV